MRKSFMIFSVLLVLCFVLFSCSNNDSGSDPSAIVTPVPTQCGVTVFGYETDANEGTGITATCNADYILANIFTASSSGRIDELRVKLNASSNFIAALYEDNGGEPGSLLASSGVISGTAGWNIADITDINITLGTKYWIGVITQAKSYIMNSGSGNSEMVFSYPWSSASTTGIGTHSGWSAHSYKGIGYAYGCK